MESKFSKLQVDVLKAASQGESKGVKSPVSAEFKVALSAELESIARVQSPAEESAPSVGVERFSNGKNMPPIASGVISQNLLTVLIRCCQISPLKSLMCML
jgi:hypothetical protein